MTKQVNYSLPKLFTAGVAVAAAQVAGARKAPGAGTDAKDTWALQNHGRALQQIPAPAAPTPPPPPAPPPAAGPGYFDILATATTCGAVVPDWNHYGACTEPVNTTLSRINLLAAQGCKVFNLDLYEPTVLGNAAYNATAMSMIQAVVDHAESLGMSVLLGPSKDDATMNDRVPTGDTQGLLVALANQFGGYTNVGLNVGGMPSNPNGSETASIAQTYSQISSAVRATGYKGLLTFTAPEQDGRTGLNYFVPTANRIQDPNMRFVLLPYSSGNSTEALSWMQPCVGTLPCAVISGLQVNSTLNINNNINQVTAELTYANTNAIPTLVTPWDSSAILSSQGEQVMLTNNTCLYPNATVSISSAGQSLINLQKGIVG